MYLSVSDRILRIKCDSFNLGVLRHSPHTHTRASIHWTMEGVEWGGGMANGGTRPECNTYLFIILLMLTVDEIKLNFLSAVDRVGEWASQAPFIVTAKINTFFGYYTQTVGIYARWPFEFDFSAQNAIIKYVSRTTQCCVPDGKRAHVEWTIRQWSRTNAHRWNDKSHVL